MNITSSRYKLQLSPPKETTSPVPQAPITPEVPQPGRYTTPQPPQVTYFLKHKKRVSEAIVK